MELWEGGGLEAVGWVFGQHARVYVQRGFWWEWNSGRDRARQKCGLPCPSLLPATESCLSACSAPPFKTAIYRQGKQQQKEPQQVGPSQPLGLPLAMADWPEALMGSAAI